MNSTSSELSYENPYPIATDPIVVCTEAGHVAYANDTARRLTEDLKVGEIGQILPDNHLSLVVTCLAGSSANGLLRREGFEVFWQYAPLPSERHVSLRGRTGSGSGHAALLQEALDRLAIGVVVASANLKLLAANDAAIRLIEEAWPKGREDTLLFESYPRVASLLREQIRKGGGPITLFSSGAPAVEIEAMVLPAWSARESFTLVYFVHPDALPGHMNRALRNLYGLTQGETRVAEALLSTCNVGHVAETLGLSRNTVRTHLRNVWRKTGTVRATELVRRLAVSVAARVIAEPRPSVPRSMASPGTMLQQ